MTATMPTAGTSAVSVTDGRRYEARFETIDPISAQQMLTHNSENRRLEPKLVEFYADEMTAGRWIFDGAPIRFSNEGVLLDGQHRLSGVVASGTTQKFLVIYGLPKEAQDVMDVVRRRTAADMLTLYNETDVMVLSALARQILAWRKGQISTSTSIPTGRVSNVEVRELVESDPLIRWAVDLGRRIHPTTEATPTAIAFSIWMLGREDQVLTEAFFQSISEMRTNGHGDPLYAAITRIQKLRKTTGAHRSTVPVSTQAFVYIRAWDAWRKGEQLTQILVQRGGKPLAFPRLPETAEAEQPEESAEPVEA